MLSPPSQLMQPHQICAALGAGSILYVWTPVGQKHLFPYLGEASEVQRNAL